MSGENCENCKHWTLGKLPKYDIEYCMRGRLEFCDKGHCDEYASEEGEK